MPFRLARMVGDSSRPVRTGSRIGLAALLLALGSTSLQNAVANGDTRTLSFHNTHTNEDLTVTYKVNGRYDDEALARINHILRDWRIDKPTKMDPHLMDLVWDVYREVEATQPIAIVCGYRSPDTNAMLRRRSSGVAKFSQHMLGKAMDFYLPGVPLDRLREAGLRASRGGVGFYPSSNFVHLDTGGVRHWPRMPEAQLAKVMAKGPLSSSTAAREVQTASASIPNPFAKLFGGQQDEPQTMPATTTTAIPARGEPARQQTAAAAPKAAPRIEKTVERPTSVTTVAQAPTPPARTAAAKTATQPAQPVIQPATFEVASATSRPVQLRPAQAASLVNRGETANAGTATSAANTSAANSSANSVISERGFWQGLPDTDGSQAGATGKSNARRTASADSQATGSAGPWQVPGREPSSPDTLAYAPAGHPGNPTTRPGTVATARPAPAQRDTTVAVKRTGNEPTVVTSPAPALTPAPAKVGQKFNDPWMRAMIIAPSAGGFMSTGLLGSPDYRVLSPYLRKPDTAVMMTFSQDPYLGMTTVKFAGTPVVFVPTVTFGQRTAALR